MHLVSLFFPQSVLPLEETPSLAKTWEGWTLRTPSLERLQNQVRIRIHL